MGSSGGRYEGFLVRVLQMQGDIVQVEPAEMWEVPRSVLRRAPTDFRGENVPIRNMVGDRDPFLHTPGSSGALRAGEQVVLEGAPSPAGRSA